ncbi:DUF722 domain-containing protein [Clostridium baratii]|uniref:DUF722 domain-containing protein n=1 Tax=Clostridium baratii TaxID=1561 RepID=UPI0029434A66|nr:DUF722 domain-containing protein [Clostridium baratii]
MIDKNLFRKTEAILYDYNNLALKIDLLKAEIKDMEETYQGCGSIAYEERTQATNKFNSSVENEIIQREKELRALKLDLNGKIKLKRRIDAAIQGLKKDEERKLVELRYINKRPLSWNQIAYVLKYSQEYCRKDLRKKAINKIGDTIFYNPYIQQNII